MTYTKQEMASLLDGRTMGKEISRDEEKIARDSGLVVVFGYSDDIAEFNGAIDDEIGCYNGGLFYVNRKKVLGDHDTFCQCDYCGYAAVKAKCAIIKALWDVDDTYSWTYETEIPHACFDILEDGEKFCRGICFSVNDLPEI